MTTKDPTNTERQARFRERMRAEGMERVADWIPAKHKPLFRAVAAALRDGKTVTITPQRETHT